MAQVTIQQAFDLALQHHRAGRLREAEQLYRQILTQEPQRVEVLHNLGVLAYQAGRHDDAADLIRRAVVLRPNWPEAHSDLGEAMRCAGQLDQSIAAHRQAIALRPDYAEAHNNLGNALRDNGKIEQAIAAYRQAIACNPSLAEAHNNLGNALCDNGQPDVAIPAYHQAIALRPNYAEAHGNLGEALRQNGHPDQAVTRCHQAIALGHDGPEAHYNLGNALRDKGQMNEAIAAYRRAIALKTDFVEAHNNLGVALKDNGQIDEAISVCRQAIALNPNRPEAHCNLGHALSGAGQLNEAIAAYRQSIALNPKLPNIHSNLLLLMQLHPDYDAAAITEEHRRWNHQHAEPLKTFIQPHLNDRRPGRRLRIGYVSADFQEHALARFLLPLLRNHDKSQVEVFAYAQMNRADAITQQMRALVDGWRSITGLPDAPAADLIRRDQIDILVDLSGHTQGNRLMVMARKPAPVQVTYLGYANTTGLTSIDYRLTDALADPPGLTEQFHSEQLIRLPDGMWCTDPIETVLPVNELPALSASNGPALSASNGPARSSGRITFGCLNNFLKVNEKMLTLWASILLKAPWSRMILMTPEGSVPDWVFRVMKSRQIATQRIEFRKRCPGRSDFLRLYHEVDIALDPFPYHGTATTLEALWMGLPVVTLAGSAHVSRVGASLLQRIGLPELVAQTPEQYVQIAAELADDLPRLRELRQGLRQRMQRSPLMDGPQFARNIEAAYRQMWWTWCESIPGS
jgi:predicted O-linked N-acetylglucosamine transferase (SPINDLY family)